MTTTIPLRPPPDFHKFCGPRAIAALLGIHPQAAAGMLWHAQRTRGQATAPGTRNDDALLVLASRRRITEYTAARHLGLAALTHHEELVADLNRKYQADTAEPIREPEPELKPFPTEKEERRVIEYVQRTKSRDHLTLREFDAPGDWLLGMGPSSEAGSLIGHFIAMRDGEVIAGDHPDLPHYGATAIDVAWRIETPTTEETT